MSCFTLQRAKQTGNDDDDDDEDENDDEKEKTNTLHITARVKQLLSPPANLSAN